MLSIYVGKILLISPVPPVKQNRWKIMTKPLIFQRLLNRCLQIVKFIATVDIDYIKDIGGSRLSSSHEFALL